MAKTEEPAEDGTKRERTTLDLAKRMAAAAERRDTADARLQECKEACREADEQKKTAERARDAIQEEVNHLVGLLIGNERGQLPLDWDAPKTQAELPGPSESPQTTTGKRPVDLGARKPVSVLQEFGLTVSKFEQFCASRYGDTIKIIGELEALMRESNGYYWKEIKGWGEQFATGDAENSFPNIYMRFRQKYPVPSEQHDGPRKCLKCGFVYRDASRCKHCKSTTWEPWTEGDQPAEGGPDA